MTWTFFWPGCHAGPFGSGSFFRISCIAVRVVFLLLLFFHSLITYTCEFPSTASLASADCFQRDDKEFSIDFFCDFLLYPVYHHRFISIGGNGKSHPIPTLGLAVHLPVSSHRFNFVFIDLQPDALGLYKLKLNTITIFYLSSPASKRDC